VAVVHDAAVESGGSTFGMDGASEVGAQVRAGCVGWLVKAKALLGKESQGYAAQCRALRTVRGECRIFLIRLGGRACSGEGVHCVLQKRKAFPSGGKAFVSSKQTKKTPARAVGLWLRHQSDAVNESYEIDRAVVKEWLKGG
jgi:hypothetical protein